MYISGTKCHADFSVLCFRTSRLVLFFERGVLLFWEFVFFVVSVLVLYGTLRKLMSR